MDGRCLFSVPLSSARTAKRKADRGLAGSKRKEHVKFDQDLKFPKKMSPLVKKREMICQ